MSAERLLELRFYNSETGQWEQGAYKTVASAVDTENGGTVQSELDRLLTLIGSVGDGGGDGGLSAGAQLRMLRRMQSGIFDFDITSAGGGGSIGASIASDVAYGNERYPGVSNVKQGLDIALQIPKEMGWNNSE